MDAEKRKRDDLGKFDGKRAKLEEDNGREDRTVTEEEVEEFFTILGRIHAAARHFRKTDGAGRKFTSKKLRLSFEAQDFGEDNGVINKDDQKKMAEENSGLDLNSDPASKESSN